MTMKPVSVPQQFQRRVNTGSNNQRQQSQPRDHLLTVEEYDIAHGQLIASEPGRQEAGKEQKTIYYKIAISKETLERVRKAPPKTTMTEPPKFLGSDIDARMAQYIPPGHKIVATRLQPIKYIKQELLGKLDQSVTLAECNWISHVTSPEQEKTFYAVTTGSAREGVMKRFQTWDETAISCEDQEALNALADNLDAISRDRAAEKQTTARGFQFRTLIRRDGKPTVVDNTHMFCYIGAARDVDNNVVAAARNVTGDDLLNIYNEYVAHIDARYPEASYPGREVEVKIYNEFPCSKSNKSLRIPEHPFLPLYKLVNQQVLLSVGDEESDAVIEGGWAIRGIVELTADVVKVEGKNATVQDRNIVKAFHPNGYAGMLDTMIKTSKGEKVEIDPELRLYQRKADEAKAAEAAATAAAGNAAAPVQQRVAASAATAVQASPAAAPVQVAAAPAAQAAPNHDVFEEDVPWETEDAAPAVSAPVQVAAAPAPAAATAPRRFGK